MKHGQMSFGEKSAHAQPRLGVRGALVALGCVLAACGGTSAGPSDSVGGPGSAKGGEAGTRKAAGSDAGEATTNGSSAGTDSGATLQVSADASSDATPKGATDAVDAAHAPAPLCMPHGSTCSESVGATPCCTDSCTKGLCGCLPEGAHLIDDGGVGNCCDGLQPTNGFCGTNACVPDGTPCGGDAGVVCCNDDCNGSVCGGA